MDLAEEAGGTWCLPFMNMVASFSAPVKADAPVPPVFTLFSSKNPQQNRDFLNILQIGNKKLANGYNL